MVKLVSTDQVRKYFFTVKRFDGVIVVKGNIEAIYSNLGYDFKEYIWAIVPQVNEIFKKGVTI